MQSFKIDWKVVLPKILKYFTELVVVVFGVFLGFMANNYAEDLKQKEYVNATIKEMYESIQNDIDDAEINKGGHQNGLKALNYFFKMVRNQAVDVDSFRIYHNYLTRNFISVQNTSPFETIRSKGFNVITNDTLRRKMIKVFDFQYEILEKLEEDYQESQIYSNESHRIDDILAKSLVFDDNLKLVDIKRPLIISNEERSRLILILKRIYNTRLFNITIYDDVIREMKNLRTNISEVYPFVLSK